MRTILLAGYKQTDADSCPWLQFENGLPILEARVRQARKFGQECIVVLAGVAADEALRICPSLENCELVFDTHESPNLLSNLKAALATSIDPAIVLPAELSFGEEKAVFDQIGRAAQQGARAESDVIHQSFPMLLTLRGCDAVLRNKNITSLADLLPQP